MFAIFFTEAMDPFYEICSSFPTVIFTILLMFCVLYWVLAVLGLVDIEFLDIDVPSDLDADGITPDFSNLSVMAGVMLKLGLNGVPLTIVLTLISLLGWMLSFTVVYFVNPLIPGAHLKFVIGIPIFLGTLYACSMVTALLIKPLRPIFKAADQHVERTIVGQVGIIRTGRADQKFGEATVEDGGAGLIVKVRSYKEDEFTRGDRVVLLEYVAEENLYRVISEQDFTGN